MTVFGLIHRPTEAADLGRRSDDVGVTEGARWSSPLGVSGPGMNLPDNVAKVGAVKTE